MSKSISSLEMELPLPPTPPMDLNDSNSSCANEFKVRTIDFFKK